MDSSTGYCVLSRLDAHREDGKIVGPVEETGDVAEAFRLALGAEHAAGLVKPFQRGVGGGRDLGDDFQGETVRHRGNGQALGVERDIRSASSARPSSVDRQQLQFFAMQNQRRAGGRCARSRAGRGDARRFGIEREIQLHGLDAEIGRLVIGQMNGAGFFGTHGALRDEDRTLEQERDPTNRQLVIACGIADIAGDQPTGP